MSLEPTFANTGAGPRLLLKRLREIMADTSDPQQRLDTLVAAIAANMVADVCSIYLRRAGDELELFATEGLRKSAVHKTRLAWGEGIVGLIAARGHPMNLAEAPLHPAFAYRPETGEEPLKAFLGVPVIRNARVLGVLTVQNRTVRVYTEEETEALQTVATVLAEVAVSGELLEADTTDEVDRVLHGAIHDRGRGVVAGVAFGKVAFHEPQLPKHKTFAANVGEEAGRLETALDDLRKSIDDLIARNVGLEGVPKDVLEVYRLFAYDKGWKERLREAVYSGLTAEAAVERVLADNRRRMRRSRDPYMRERLHDLEDLSRRVLRHLAGDNLRERETLPDAAILFAQTLGPADLLEYDRDRLRGLVLADGTSTSHVAIVARALDLPVVGGARAAIDGAEPGDEAIIDGAGGDVHVRPPSEITKSYQGALDLQNRRAAELAALADLPAVTTDGCEISLHMNAGLMVDMPHLAETGADGIGLFRTELQFLIAATLPRISAQTQLYRSIMDAAGDKPVVFRTADIGGDKALPYLETVVEANPAMGRRGVRLAVDRPGLLRGQLRALIAAAAGGPLSVLIPMVTIESEIAATRAMIDLEVARAERWGRPVPASLKVGAMIETPAAAWDVARIARSVDFLSIGGNDLAQFFFACDRETPDLADRYDILHPSYLSFVARIAETAAASGTPLSFCGEAANDPVAALGLVGVGIRSFSVPAAAVGVVKQAVRGAALADIERAVGTDEPRAALQALFSGSLPR